MPADPLLIPSVQDPHVRLLQRVTMLEGQMRTVQAARDITVTPIGPVAAGSSQAFTWRGGRLWVMLGGQVQTPSSPTNFFAGLTPSINGHTLTNFLIRTSTDGNQILPVQTWGAEVNQSWLTPASNTLSVVVNDPGGASSGSLTGLFIEWPVS